MIANELLEKTEPLSREALARRHKAVDTKTGEVTYPQLQKGLTQLLRRLDEGGLSKLMVEMVLLGLVETQSPPDSDPLIASAKRHRVDTAKLRTAVEAELSAKTTKIIARKKKLAIKDTAKVTKSA